jgi:hypothetical protein
MVWFGSHAFTALALQEGNKCAKVLKHHLQGFFRRI